MGGLGWQELIIVLIIIIIIFGAGKLPQMGSALGKTISDFKAEAGGDRDEERQIERGTSERASSLTAPARDRRDEVVVTSGGRREVHADEV